MLRELANNLEPNADTTADEQVFPNRAACLNLKYLAPVTIATLPRRLGMSVVGLQAYIVNGVNLAA